MQDEEFERLLKEADIEGTLEYCQTEREKTTKLAQSVKQILNNEPFYTSGPITEKAVAKVIDTTLDIYSKYPNLQRLYEIAVGTYNIPPNILVKDLIKITETNFPKNAKIIRQQYIENKITYGEREAASIYNNSLADAAAKSILSKDIVAELTKIWPKYVKGEQHD